jgi:hypothetical protein
MAVGTFNVLAKSEIIGKVKFTGANDIGPQIVLELNKVMFRPANAIGLITDEWGQMQLTGEVLVDDTGIFGTITHPDTGMVAPITDAYYIGKGVVEVQLGDDIAYRSLGDVPTFEFEPTIETLPHYSHQYGVRSKDLEVVTLMSATLNLTLDEWTYDNLMLVFMGEEVVTPLMAPVGEPQAA